MSANYKTISTPEAPAAVGPYVQATQAGPFTFLSGCIGLVPSTGKVVEGGVEEQCTQVLSNLEAVVKASGSDLSHVVKTTVFLQSLGDFAKINALYAAKFAPYTPARSCVEVAKLPLGVLIEIEAIVYNDSKTVFACGSSLFADGYVNAAGGASRYILQKAYPGSYTARYGSLFSSLQFVGIVIGQLTFGYVADRVGRKPGMIFASLWIILFSILSGIAFGGDNTANLWKLLIAYRFLIGIGIGAEYPAGSVAASESTEDPGIKKGIQQMLLVLSTNTAIDFGFVAAYLVPLICLQIFGENRLEWIWRITLGFGCVSAFIVLFFRLSMSEPKLYQQNSMKDVAITKLPWGLIFKKYWSRLLGVCVAWAVYDWVTYPAGIYSSTIVTAITGDDASMTTVLAWDAVINAFYLPGTIIGAFFVDLLGPKYTMITGFICQAIIGFAMSASYDTLQRHVAGWAVCYGIYLSFGEFGPGNNLGVLAAKSTGPTAVRGIFYAIAAAVGKIFAFIATYVYTEIIDDFGGSGTTLGNTGPVYIGSALSLFAAVITFFLIPNINADFMSREDEIFRAYLEENGYDTSVMGLKPDVAKLDTERQLLGVTASPSADSESHEEEKKQR